MLTYIERINVYGVKNIKDSITVNFYNKTVGKKASLEKSNIKAIYGPNGAGKTAIVHAMKIYKLLLTEQGYLFSTENQTYLKQIINKESKKFKICVEFFAYDENTFDIKGRYIHELALSLEKDEFYISSEKFYKRLTNRDKLLFESKEGALVFSELVEQINDFSKHQLKKRSIVDLTFELLMELVPEEDLAREDVLDILYLMRLSLNIFVRTPEVDEHSFYLFNKLNKEDLRDYKSPLVTVDSRYSYRVHKDNLDDFLKDMNGLENFIKIFKKDLKGISFEQKEDKEYVVLEPIMHYENFNIHLEFESAGIKKLAELYILLKRMDEGDIVFIDELDANINDIYLMKLLEYFNESNIGQFVFTTHNIAPMEVLDNNKHGIDFISEDFKIVKWVRSGNYSPVNVYRSGLIKGLPFNIYPFDFMGVFSNGDTDD